MSIIINSILIILGLIILMLSIPIRLRFNGRLSLSRSSAKYRFKCLLGFKNRGIGIYIYPRKRFSIGSYENPLFTFTMKGSKKEKSNKELKRKFVSIIEKFRKVPMIKMMKTLFRSFRWEECSISGKIGLKSPMHTGMIFGWLQGYKNILRMEKCNIELNPTFSPELDTDLNGTIHVRFSPMKTALQTGITYFKYQK